ncbi:hypothetical protein pb186bvf_006633 [Paramecium bursaria]
MSTVRRKVDSLLNKPNRGRCISEIKEPQVLVQLIDNCIQRSQHSIDKIIEIRARSKDRKSSCKKYQPSSPSFKIDNMSLIYDQPPQKLKLFNFQDEEPSFRAKDLPLQMNRLELKQKPIIMQKENRKYIKCFRKLQIKVGKQPAIINEFIDYLFFSTLTPIF